MLTPQDVHVDQVLTDYAYSYAQSRAGFIGELVSPPLDVQKQSDKFYVGDKSAFTLETYDRAPTAEYPMVTWSLSSDTFFCDVFGVSTAMPEELMVNADAVLNLGQKAARVCVDKLALAYEKRVADIIFSASVFTNTAALGAADRWNSASSDPIKKVADCVDAVADKIFMPANTMICGYAVMRALQKHPDILANIYGDGPRGIPTVDRIADVLGLDRIIVGNAKYLVGSTLTQIWGKCASICYMDPNAGRGTDQVVVPMRTFVWAGLNGGGRFAVSQPEYVRARRSYVWYCDDATDEKVISVDAAYLLTTVVD